MTEEKMRDALIVAQILQQLDRDGVMVGVSREALDVVLAALSTKRDAGPTPPSIEEAARTVHDTFKRDLEQGYRTRDKEFAVTLLGAALSTKQDAERRRGLVELEMAAIALSNRLHTEDEAWNIVQDWPEFVALLRSLSPSSEGGEEKTDG